ncbi:beta-hexosaminidase [Agathobaculum sp. NSJ-28]|uniref:Beta-hexosaminidase n=2 Tax=Agathobaculum TaxID=2048137 RepID=A0A923LV84_9FIRM|nr:MULTISPECIES: glycoside hydrolase family 3 N-terminal domain-containing protein [Butyricicoccaceae]MBS6884054.1 beta-hexosaminidase [Clostridiaceae bacterium]SCI80747.1 beta-hexosaminidase [uncultured Butyricicoccus sp.]MBC5724765.1 beta-hexosaminidase [Agathobaculum faecis]MCU6788543.1 beta-hexosaminidase [Agathobaculum ammoniilyticum]WOC76221.1 glycoside hydrolase family 3 N-terminal domain-containing protein [Intestinibacillus sp. NTUH-41-i26]
MKKKWLSLLLAVLCLCGLAACKGDTPADTAPPDAPAQVETGTGGEAAEDSVEAAAGVAEEDISAAEHYVNNLPLESQVAQMFFARCPEADAAVLAGQYDIGGYILFGRDFEGQTKESVAAVIQSYQDAAATPMLIGVDEEGGTVVRISSNPNFRADRFWSPQALYNEGGFALITSDAKEKDELLASIGVNVNFAPVCDVSTDPADFINARAFGRDAAQTSEYVRTVVAQMLSDQIGMVLKHFPGYGNNLDTHTGIAIDERPIESFRESDFLPFRAGIDAGAQSVLVSHNIVTCMDAELPASLSPAVHQVLRDELGFDGVVMTDDLIMEAITDYTGGADAAVLAVQAGNDMLVSSDFVTQYNAVLAAVQDGTISADRIRESAIRVIQWKIDLGLLAV